MRCIAEFLALPAQEIFSPRKNTLHPGRDRPRRERGRCAAKRYRLTVTGQPQMGQVAVID
jgi:hypothetical protein